VPISYEPCVVSFIDVLGFRDLISTWSAGNIFNSLSLLKAFTRPDEGDATPTPRTRKRSYSRAFAYALSDSIIRVRTYDTQFHDGALFAELLDLLHAQVSLVANGVLIRAGVTVGDTYVGWDGEGPVFGPALVRAYDIESQKAVFPRVVVDEVAIKQHQLDRRLRSDTNTLDYEIRAIAGLLTAGRDGTRFIDYLRASRSEYEELSSYFAFLERHAKLVREGLTRGYGRKVTRKYQWLARYHDTCISELLREARATCDMNDALYEEGLRMKADEFLRSLLIDLARGDPALN
jgi:hypothetical protein